MTQRLQHPLVKKYALYHIRVPSLINVARSFSICPSPSPSATARTEPDIPESKAFLESLKDP